MANRWCDGFGRYGGTLAYMLNGSSGQAWAQIDGGFSLSNANPRTGNWHLRYGDGVSSCAARRVFGAQLAEVFVGLAVYCHSLPVAETTGDFNGVFLGSFRDQANGVQCRLMLGTDGALVLILGDESDVIYRTVPVIGAGAYQHIEIYAKAGNGTAGAFEVRVDEVTRMNLTGIDTVVTANVEFSQFAVGREAKFVGAPAFPMIDIADVYCNDTVDDGSGCNWFVGDCKSGVLMADADTAQAGFSLSAGAQGYPLINDTPPDDSDYLYTASTAAESDFGLVDTPGNLSEILTVRPFVRAMKDDAGTCTIAPNMKSGTTKGTVSGQPVTTAFAYYDSNVPFDPATGVPWTKSGLDSGKHVVERTA
jgi:hypothetical protein